MAESAFTWGNAGEKLTPSERRRRIAQAMIQRGSSTAPIQHWTQGAARVAEALLGGYEAGQLDREEKAAQAQVAADAASMGLPGASAVTPSAPSMAGGAAGARSMAMPNIPPDMKVGIVETAKALGTTPEDVATAISYETGGTFNPTQAGPTTKWGQHRGLIQFGEPQAKQYGVDWSNPVGSQLGANGAIVAYMRDRGFKPGMNFMDFYSTINAGAPGLYNRSDAAAGGAPGTVADKVNNQMAGHRARAQRMFADLPAPGAAPVEMATGEPGFAVPPAPANEALPIMQPGGALPNFDQETGRWLGPSNPPALAAAPQSVDAPPSSMDASTFNAIASNNAPLDPVFQTEGVSQPWMGTALPAAAPAPVQVAQAPTPLPPPRPADLAMPQADLPAPGAVPAIGQMPPSTAPVIDPNSPDAGMRAQIAADAQGPAQSPFARVVAALGGQGGPAQAAAAPSPAVQTVAQAMPAQAAAAPSSPPSAGVDRVASAMRVLNSPYAQPGQRAVAQMIVQQAFKDPAEAEMKRLQLDKARREAEAAPLDLEGRRLDIEGKKKALGKSEAPATKVVKQADGSEVALQWDQATGEWVPLKAPQGGNAVKAPTKLTEQQSKDLTYFNRGVQALEAFEKDGDAYANGLERGASQLPGGNYLNSEQFQKARQSGRNFLASILRKDSGAAITENEEKIYGEVFLPQPGDKPGMLAQKREARRQAIEAIKGGLGTAEVLARGSEILKAPPPNTAPDRSALEAEARRRGLIK